jgi:SAM-dependent methyltransferase
MNQQAAQFVGSFPENYDQGLGPHIFIDYAKELAARAGRLNPASVLELAAGTGIVTRQLRDALDPDCALTASDLNPPMLNVAKTKFRDGEQINFEQIDATSIGMDDASFDLVACQFGVMFFPDKDQSYAEVFRILKPGGTYLFNLWDSWDANPFARIAQEAVEALYPEDPPGFYRVPFGYHDEVEIDAAVRRAGFDQVTIERLPVTAKIQTAESFAQGLVFGNPLKEEIDARGGDPEAMKAELTRRIESELGAEMPLQAVFVTAVKP